MEKFKFIKYLDIDQWWRTAIIEDENKNTLKVSFMEEREEKCVFNEGDIFEANMVITLICKHNIVENQEKYYIQNMDDYSHVEAVVKVEKK